MSSVAAFEVFCSCRPQLLLAVLRRRVGDGLQILDPGDLRPLPLLVPSAAIRDRLRDDLAEGLGVCAGVQLLLPGEFMDVWLPRRLGLTIQALPAEVIRWRLAQTLDEVPLIAPERRDAWDGRRAALASQVTEALIRLDQWDRERTTARWDAGQDSPVDATHPWLKPLWNTLRTIHDPAAQRVRLLDAVAAATDLPPLVLTYLTPELSPAVLEVLAALGQRTRVQAILAQPVPGDWSDHQLSWRDGGGAEEAWTHRLLAQWGVEHRQALRRFDAAGAAITSDEAHFIAPATDSLLAQVQGDLIAGSTPSPGSAAPDHSLALQRAPGARAEVEALAHRLAGWMAAATIHPHEVCIACPDPETYAPLLAGILQALGEGLGCAVDSRPPRIEADPAIGVACRLLEVLPGRWPASAVLDLLACAPVAAAHDLGWFPRLQAWCDKADLRFAVDAEHRQALGLPADSAATWRAGLERLALSRCLGADTVEVPAFHHRLPVANLDELDAELVHHLITLLLPLLEAAAAWRSPHPATWWVSAVAHLTAHARAEDGDEAHHSLTSTLGRWCDEMTQAGQAEALLTADVVASILVDGSAAAPLRTGGVAVGTPTSLRGHPWRIVCCLGMSDGAFPRQMSGGQIDPLVYQPVPGMPDPRHQDRAALLDLVLAAEDHLLISWVGLDPRSGQDRPPCTAVSDLLEVLSVTTGLPTAQLIDTIGLGPTTSLPPGPWPSQARKAQAQASLEPGRSPSPLLPTTPLPLEPPTSLAWTELTKALENPPAAYLKRLGIALDQTESGPADHELFTVASGLETWMLKDSLLRHQLGGKDPTQLVTRWHQAGCLPQGAWGAATVQSLQVAVDCLLEIGKPWYPDCLHDPEAVTVTLADGTRIIAAFALVHLVDGPVIERLGKANAKYRLRVWLAGLIWQAAGKTGAGLLLAEDGATRVGATASALDTLERVVARCRQLRSVPVPLGPDILEAWGVAARDGDAAVALDAAIAAWHKEPFQGTAPAEEPAARCIWSETDDPWKLHDAAGWAKWMSDLGVSRWMKPVKSRTKKG